MIGKYIPARKIVSKAAYIRALLKYITSAESIEHGMTHEKCVAHGMTGFLLEQPSIEYAIAEMTAVANAARCERGVEHFLLSWAPTERPTTMQVKEAVSLTLALFGMQDHQAVWGLHADKNHLHVHIAVSRVDPIEQKVVAINRRFNSNAIMQAAVLVAHTQGWHVPKARYEVLNGEVVPIRKTAHERLLDKVFLTPKPPPQYVLHYEKKFGTAHPWRKAQEVWLAACRNSGTFDLACQEAARHGYSILTTPKGGHVIVHPDFAERPLPLSSLSRDATEKALKRHYASQEHVPLPVPAVQRALPKRSKKQAPSLPPASATVMHAGGTSFWTAEQAPSMPEQPTVQPPITPPSQPASSPAPMPEMEENPLGRFRP